MMKTRRLLLIWLFLFLGACTNAIEDESSKSEKGEEDQMDIAVASTFQAKVLDSGSMLMVEPLEGEWELNSADKITVPLQKTELYDLDGKKIDKKQIEEGALVEIIYDGMVMESHPAQIGNIEQIILIE